MGPGVAAGQGRRRNRSRCRCGAGEAAHRDRDERARSLPALRDPDDRLGARARLHRAPRPGPARPDAGGGDRHVRDARPLEQPPAPRPALEHRGAHVRPRRVRGDTGGEGAADRPLRPRAPAHPGVPPAGRRGELRSVREVRAHDDDAAPRRRARPLPHVPSSSAPTRSGTHQDREPPRQPVRAREPRTRARRSGLAGVRRPPVGVATASVVGCGLANAHRHPPSVGPRSR